MPVKYSTSAALLFTEQELGGPCVENESYPVISNSASVIAQGNGDRVGLLIMNLSVNNINVSTQGNVTANSGILLPAAGGYLSINVRDDFTLPSREWSGIGTGLSCQLYVLEIIRFTSNAENN